MKKLACAVPGVEQNPPAKLSICSSRSRGVYAGVKRGVAVKFRLPPSFPLDLHREHQDAMHLGIAPFWWLEQPF